ncbi:hypothetical protein H8356DRAFT_1746604 [Neocallimastix lanati (nom. inval.)]|jgi:hypothetical protein|uniref:DUF567-domain-containing protein n=1 Tax=Neocallimastix californiae TaxID=1754190 RepID=A0A1Y2BW24_9FUNG|nr:hypothetical protein H8356DRAFT_1746604 [Neocallimastix sp. JGI-2020a]ORY38959.1 hypothetical protein LY90DRAFT_704378 [Neocallimastix californiae]|eukprot:ORY38959.1 hypothetical protein LY90DRAFT_704378 [Neocallimastix californiae]
MGGKDYQNRELEEPQNDIVAVDDRFVFHQPTHLIISSKLISLTSSDITITDSSGAEYFRCNDELVNKTIINDLDEFPIVNIQSQILSLKDKINIYRLDTNKEIVGSITQKSVINVKKYTLDFINHATDKKDFLDFKCDVMGNNCGVFYGKEKDGAPMVCRIIRKIEGKSFVSSPQEYYYVDISPGVDIALIVAATICFSKLKKE